ncbi:formate dehydrogenase subunit delta [Beijerinckia mobilis]|uniref:formate dehydrogenase subunit delta n=1 Tax=Beijerinckia mobilis TaxID=231434 RepID=UPI0005550995|nr:formate dehydrogenase subunit delta [Beijerinckia mobilis]
MSSKNETLIRMANQIATFFRPYSREEAVKGIRSHIEAFWSPTMRRDLCILIAKDPDGLDAIVIEAVPCEIENHENA